MTSSDKRFMHNFEKKIVKTIKKYKLFSKQNKVGVAVSGGKDSTVCLHVLNKLGYKVVGLTVDAVIGNYTKKNLERLRTFCKQNKIPLKELCFREEFGGSLCYLRDILKEKGFKYKSCMLCGILRRYLLNKYAKHYKFNVLTTGHNIDDEAQSILMNIARNDQARLMRLGPITGIVKSKGFVQRVKPLYFCTEEEITRYSKLMGFDVIYTRCPCSVNAFRRKFRNELDQIEKKTPGVKENIDKYYMQNNYP